MTEQGIKPEPGRRPVYPVDADVEQPTQREERKPRDDKDDPASDENTDSANHTNDDEPLST